jgi:hypothetical protein
MKLLKRMAALENRLLPKWAQLVLVVAVIVAFAMAVRFLLDRYENFP